MTKRGCGGYYKCRRTVAGTWDRAAPGSAAATLATSAAAETSLPLPPLPRCLNRHIVDAHLQRLLGCPLCPQKFTCDERRITHVTETHFHYCCLTCREFFEDMEAVRRHPCRPEESQWQCDYSACRNALFASEGALLLHLVETHSIHSARMLAQKCMRLRSVLRGYCVPSPLSDGDGFVVGLPDDFSLLVKYRAESEADLCEELRRFSQSWVPPRNPAVYVNRQPVKNITQGLKRSQPRWLAAPITACPSAACSSPTLEHSTAEGPSPLCSAQKHGRLGKKRLKQKSEVARPRRKATTIHCLP